MVNKIKTRIIYNDNYQENCIDSINILKQIHEKAISLFEMELLKITRKKFQVKVLQHKITSNLDIIDNPSFFLNTLSFFNIDCFFFISISFPFINKLSEFLFGNGNDIFHYKNNNLFTASKLYVICQLMNIFIRSYNNIFPKWILFYKRYRTYRKKMDFEFLHGMKYQSYLRTEFICQYKNFESKIIVHIPDIAFLEIKNKYQKYYTKNKILSNFNTTRMLLKHIYHIELNCTIQLDKFFVSSDYILNLNIGDVLHINKPTTVTICTENNIPILTGEYFFDDSGQLILYVKDNFVNTNLNIKKGKNE